MEIDKKIIIKLVQSLEELKKKLKVIEINSEDNSVEEETEVSGVVIKSPIVGTVYLAPEPGSKMFIEVGKKVKKGDTIMIIEAMKTMNHIPSSSDGIVKEICVEDGQPVEFDQKIAILE